MAEVNLIRDGFVFNTLKSSGAVSGTQTVSIAQINALVDDDVSATALTVSGGYSVVLDADLGARWKLSRIEYYTAEASNANFSMRISDDNLSYTTVTMTGTPPFYIGNLDPTTVSGSPRYIRLEHRPPALDTVVREWKAINDDSFVNFGQDGTQTEVELTDTPVGQASPSVVPLVLKNAQNYSTSAFVFVDRTFNDAEEEIEVASSPNGPFFGRATSTAVQPSVTPWESGSFIQTRLVPPQGYSVLFGEAYGANGWQADGISSAAVSGTSFQGITASLSPGYFINIGYGNTSNPVRFYAQDFDTVRVVTRVPFIANLTEGPRLFWTKIDGTSSTVSLPTFVSARSVTSNNTTNYNNSQHEIVFDLNGHTEWSGVITGLKVQLYTTGTLSANFVELKEVTVEHSSGTPRVGLNFVPVASGKPNLPFSTRDYEIEAASGRVILNTANQVLNSGIITNIKIFAEPPASPPLSGFFLATITGGLFPSAGPNFSVKRVVQIQTGGVAGSTAALESVDVFWPANPGDIIGYSTEGSATLEAAFVDTDTVKSYTSIDTVQLTSTTLARTGLNAASFTARNREYVFSFEAMPIDKYITSGRYLTPVFDAGADPALASATFVAQEPEGTSVDVTPLEGFSTFNARASNTPPLRTVSSPRLGESTGVGYRINSGLAETGASDFAINTKNGIVTTREVTGTNLVQNLGCAFMFHELRNELWVLNLITSGTAPLDIRPTWDVLDVVTGNYLRTQHVHGTINYSYNGLNGDEEAFEGVAFIPDYDREEIYIIQRRAFFFLGSHSFYGIALDLDGNFKNVILKSDDVGAPTLRFDNCRNIAYDGSYFYLLTAATSNSTNGSHIGIVKWGSDTDANVATWVDEIQISNIPGFGFTASNDPDAKGLGYNSADNQFWLFFDNVNGSEGAGNIAPEFFTISLTPDDNNDFTAIKLTTSGSIAESAPDVEGYDKKAADANDDWIGITSRQLGYTTDVKYISSRNSFGILRTLTAEFPHDFPLADAALFDRRSQSFFYEVGASGAANGFVPGELPHPYDVTWGAVAGTLDFQEVQKDSVLFPNGRFVQVEYVLNSSTDQFTTPYLQEARIVQGLRVVDVPASGTIPIYLRTNIPEDADLTSRVGRLKVFWELLDS